MWWSPPGDEVDRWGLSALPGDFLAVHVIKARGLRKADRFGHSDPWCLVRWALDDDGDGTCCTQHTRRVRVLLGLLRALAPATTTTTPPPPPPPPPPHKNK